MSAWLDQWYATDLDSNLIRRSIDDVHKNASRAELESDCMHQGWHLLEIGNQYVIIRDADLVKVLHKARQITVTGA